MAVTVGRCRRCGELIEAGPVQRQPDGTLAVPFVHQCADLFCAEGHVPGDDGWCVYCGELAL